MLQRRLAGKDRKCIKCGDVIPQGTVYATYRERALSYREAQNTGTMYPLRHICVTCAEIKESTSHSENN